jgi:hypothetical protein
MSKLEPFYRVADDASQRWRALMCAMRESKINDSAEIIIARAEAIRLGDLTKILEAKQRRK